ncbi:MAG: TetR/AcrR family transcriptional regulator [Mycobacterium sp.]
MDGRGQDGSDSFADPRRGSPTFQELGYATTRVEHIAKRAGVSRPTFYVYFATKQDALLAVAERSVARLTRVVEALDALPERPSDSDLAS